MRNGTYSTVAHGEVQRYRCRGCGRGLSAQTESVHYFAKRRVDLLEVFSRIRGGSSQRDIGREMGCSRAAVANAVVRLGRQAMASHTAMLCSLRASGKLCFDGLLSAVQSRDYASQITVLADAESELVLAMTHCLTERGGVRTKAQAKRIAARGARWKPRAGVLSESITLLVKELSRFASPTGLSIDTDEHPIYRRVLEEDLAINWYRNAGLLTVRRTPGSEPRTTSNPLFIVNYLDRMLRHRMKEHTRESIALGRNATMQMHRSWIFAWDHNVRQPERVRWTACPARAELADVSSPVLRGLKREFFTRRLSMRGLPVRESIRRVWWGELATPPVRWRKPQKRSGPRVPYYALRDLAFGDHQAC